MADKPAWAESVTTNSNTVTIVGLAMVAFFALGFGAWASLAPIAGAAVAPGIVAAAGKNMMIQHLEGGIIREVLVEEGDEVAKGDVLIELDDTAARAQRNRVQKRLVGLRARAERLEAERDGLDELVFSHDLQRSAAVANMKRQLDQQWKEFVTRLQRHRQETVILGQRVASLEEQIDGASAQQRAVDRQLSLIRDEAETKKQLLEQGLTQRSEYSQLLRSEANLLGQSGQTASSILSAKTQVTEAQEQLGRLKTQRVEQAVSELNDVRAEITDNVEQLQAANNVLNRVQIRAPSDGIVVSMNVNTPGNVVGSGKTLLELLPTSRDLIIQARVSPRDIDAVHIGQGAETRFSALNQRITPKIDGEVIYVSADRLIDEQSGNPYYTARLRLTDMLPDSVDQAEIYPGMPVETFIKTGERTFFSYLTKPITDSFARAFREE